MEKNALLYLALVALSASLLRNWLIQSKAASILEAPNRMFHLGCLGEACPVQPWVKADAGSGTFLHLRRPLDDSRQVLSGFRNFRYRRATAKFPDAYSCLRKGAIEQSGTDLTKVHLADLDNKMEVEVCLWRIASVSGGSTVANAWFEEISFKPRLNVYKISHYKYGSSSIYARWNHNSAPLSSFNFWLGGITGGVSGFSMEFDSEDIPVHVQLDRFSIFN